MKNILLSLLVFAFSLNGLSQNYKATPIETSSKEFKDIDTNGIVSNRLAKNFLNYSLFTLDTENLKSFARKNKAGKIQFDLSLPNLSSINISIIENDILSADYKLVVATVKGREVFEKKECITYSGSITNQLGNIIRLTLTDDVIHGEIKIDDKDYFIEPLQYIIDSKPNTIFVLYEKKDVIEDPLNTCGAIEVEKEIQKASINTNRPGYNCYRVRMAVATDFSAYTALGGTVNNASTHSIAIMNLSAPYFSNSQFNTNVDLVLVGQYISTSLATDPYTCSDCTLATGIDIFTQLPNFGTWAKNGNFGFSFDLAHNITNRYNSGTIGLAYVGTIGMTQYNTGVTSMSSSPTWLTLIHEIGHNFGLSHTFQLGQGTTGGFMDYGDGTINGAYGWNLTYSSTEYEDEVYRAANAVPSIWQTRLSSCNVIGATVTDFISNKEIQCIGSSIQFRDNSLGGPTSWSWSFQDGTPATSTDTNPLVSFSTSGIKTVTLTTNNGNGSTTKTKNIYVPSSITTAACVNSGVMASTIANDLGPTKFILNTINKSSGGSRTDGNKYFDYMCSDNTVLAANSTYNVTIKNNYASVKFQFFIDYNDDGDFLDANETIYSGDSSSTSGSVTFSFTTPSLLPKINKLLRARILSVPSSFLTTFNSCYNPGEYGQIEDYGVVFECSSPVVPTFTPIATICNGGSITLPTTSTNSISGTWSPAVNNTATTTYTFTPTSGLCASATTLTVNVNPVKTATLSSAAGTNSQTKCINTAITEISYTTTGATGATFSGLPSGVTGNWTSNTITINGTPSAAGTYDFIISLTGGCGTFTASGSIIVNAIATVTSGGPNTVCVSSSPVAFALTGASIGGSATTGAWSIISGGGILSNTAQTATPELVTFTPDANYSGTVTLRLTSNYGTGCSAVTADRVITVVPTPILSDNTGGALTVSINATTPAFANEQAGGIWSIVAGTGTASIASNGVVTGLTAGTVSVVYTYNNNCGTATKSNIISVISSVTGTISGEATICYGSTTQLSIAFTGEGPWFGTLSDGTGFSGGDNPLLVMVTPYYDTTYTITSLYNETATARLEDMSGSASILVNQPTPIHTYVTSCSTYTWQLNGTDYFESGTYRYIENCVEHILEFVLIEPTIETTVATSCGMFYWETHNLYYSESGTYRYYDENCVEHILELTVNQPTIERTVATSCGMYIWDINGSDYFETGTYSYIENCVEHILELTVNQPTIQRTIATSCGMYIWETGNHSDYMTSGTYSYIENCVEHILELTVNQPTTETTVATSCGMYIWDINGSDYFETGTYSYIENCVEHILELTINNNIITSQPINSSICKAIGGTTSLSAGVSASNATYQWYTQALATATTGAWTLIANNANYSGATTATLNITKTTLTLPATGTKYKVEITDTCGTITSDSVNITDFTVLSKAAAITVVGTLSPLLTTCQGNSVNLNLAAGSIGNIQWQSSTDGITYANVGDSIAQSALSAINLAMPFNTGALTQTTWFRVVASNGVCNAVNGTAIKITVSSPVTTGSISGGDVTVCAPLAIGFDATGNALTAAITNSTLLTLSDYTEGATILWQKSTNYINSTGAAVIWSAAGSTTNTFTASALTVNTWYRAQVTNGACKDFTVPVKITVSSSAKAGVITSATSVCTGGNITFTSAAYTGTSIQWEVSTTSALTGFTPIADANQLSFTMTTVSYAPLSKFYVRSVVTSGNCTLARSAVKTITVNPLSVPGTVKGGGTICLGSNRTLSVAGNTGTIQWQYSLDGIEYKIAPYWKTVAGVPTFFNPDSATEFSTAASTGIAATYNASNLTADVYFRAKITSGACSEAYSNAVQFTIGSNAVSGTLTAVDETVCKGTGTTLTLSGSVGAIKWLKSTNWTAATPLWTAVTTSTSGTLATGNLSVATAYKAEVTIGSCSTETSQVVPIMVFAAPLAKTITANVTSPTGTTAALAICNTSSTSKVLTIGGGSIGAIQWQKSTTSTTLGFADIAGENATTYTVTNPSIGANYFRAKFTNSCGAFVYGAAFTVHYKDCTPTKVVENTVYGKTPFAVVSYPNPFTNNFNLDVTSSSSEKVSVVVYDMIGRLLEKHLENVSEINTLSIGNNYPAGVYNVIVTQGLEVKTVRVIKK